MDKFSLNNQVEKVIRGDNSNFLNPVDTRFVINHIKKYINNYKVFKLFDDAEKLIVYTNKLNITLYEIKTNSNLTHREILGALFSHNICEDSFGDIIINNDKYYIVVLNTIKDYMINNFITIGNKKVKLLEMDLDIVNDYKLNYLDINLNVSSLRIDNIISRLIPTSRSNSNLMIKNKKVIVNYNLCTNSNYILKDNDIFSIRGIGKFKYIGIDYIKSNGKKSILIKKYM